MELSIQYRNTVIILGLIVSGTTSIAQTGACGVAVPGSPLPDLIVDANLLSSQIYATSEKFADTSCTVVEGLVTSKGKHDLMRFNASFANVGQGDLYMGDPNQCPAIYEFSPCHGHFHMDDSAAYRLWTEAGYQNWVAQRDAAAPANSPLNALLLATAEKNGDLAVGRKQGFCMMDSARYSPSAGPAKYGVCGGPGSPGNQGISVGWEDIYGPQLDGQWVEIDKLKEGRYVLEVQTNPNHTLAESDYSNNYSSVVIDYVPAKGQRPAQIAVVK